MDSSRTSSSVPKLQQLRITPSRKSSTSSAQSPKYHDGAPLRSYTPKPETPTYRDGAPLVNSFARGDGHTPYTPKAHEASVATSPGDYFGDHAASSQTRDDTGKKNQVPQPKGQ